ncbi:MAG: fibronectin type III domain-containing protein, partial [Terracidiphilus sp.]
MQMIGAAARLGARVSSIACFVTMTVTAILTSSTLWSQTFPGQIGVEAIDRPTAFMDALKDQGRLWVNNSGALVPTDSNGWPTTDGVICVFDDRPYSAWNPPMDDPAEFQVDMAGTYIISFQGQATVSNAVGNPPYPTLTFGTPVYSGPTTNTTTLTVTLPGGTTYADGQALMVISFTNTIRTYGGATNTGITNLQVIRPGFTVAQANSTTNGIFDPAFLTALAPFSYLRFMTWTGTNICPFYTAGSTPLLNWSQRSLPTDMYQGIAGGVMGSTCQGTTGIPAGREGSWGISWEYVILLANEANKDIWINIPISATGGSDPNDPTYVASPDTSSYVYNLAYLLKNGDAFTGNVGLKSGLHIYIEHSNEVWNSAFRQNGWNNNAASNEGSGSVLNQNPGGNSTDWAARRHLKRLNEISEIFQSVFGSGSLFTIIRPVYAWQQQAEGSGSEADNTLSWFNNNFGAPSSHFYGLAQGDYFYANNYGSDSTVDLVLSDLQSSSNQSVQYVTAAKATATKWGLPGGLLVYEGGPDNSNGGTGSTTNIGVEIEANRTYAAQNGGVGIDSILENHIANNFFAQGGNMFGFYELSGFYSRYGSYGAVEDYRILSTPKYTTLYNLTGYSPAPPPVPTGVAATAGNGVVTVTWPSESTATSYIVERSLSSGGTFTTVGTVSSSPAPSYPDTSVSNGTTYYYEVAAANGSSQSAPSSPPVSATPESTYPPAPVLSATSSTGTATLSWSTVTGATYDVYEGTSPGGEGSTAIATGVANTSYTTPQNLTNGTPYYFVVTAVNSNGTSPDSNEVSVTPLAAPTGLTGTSGNQQVTLTWNTVAGATSYNIFQSTTSGGEGSTPVYTGVTGPPYTTTPATLINGTPYYFTVAAANANGASSQSAQSAPVTPEIPLGTLLAYEPFGETSGSAIALTGASGGGDSGWGAAWLVQNSSAEIPGYNIVSTTPLTYAPLQTTTNYAIGGYAYESAGRQLNLATG